MMRSAAPDRATGVAGIGMHGAGEVHGATNAASAAEAHGVAGSDRVAGQQLMPAGAVWSAGARGFARPMGPPERLALVGGGQGVPSGRATGATEAVHDWSPTTGRLVSAICGCPPIAGNLRVAARD